DSMHATRTSTRITIPLPPPYGVSSTLLCLPSPKSRGLRKRTSSCPPLRARPTKLASRKPPKISGNSVTTSTRIAPSRSRDAVGRLQAHEPRIEIHRLHDAVDHRHFPVFAAVGCAHDEDVDRRILPNVAHRSELAARPDDLRAEDIAVVK